MQADRSRAHILIVEDGPSAQSVLQRIFSDPGHSRGTGQPEVPVTVVARISEVLKKVLPQELGADDYVSGSLAPPELALQFERSLLRELKPATPVEACTFGECEIDFAKMTARRAGKVVAVTTLEFKLLRYFLNNPERVLSRQELLDKVGGYNCYPTTRAVDNQILKLRQKLEPNQRNRGISERCMVRAISSSRKEVAR